MIGMNDERLSGKSVPAAWFDDEDDLNIFSGK